jgi:hypothetical protein
MEKMEELEMTSAKKILIKNNVLQTDDDFKCKYCTLFSGKNKASLAAHIRTCKPNSKNTTLTINTLDQNSKI